MIIKGEYNEDDGESINMVMMMVLVKKKKELKVCKDHGLIWLFVSPVCKTIYSSKLSMELAFLLVCLLLFLFFCVSLFVSFLCCSSSLDWLEEGKRLS